MSRRRSLRGVARGMTASLLVAALTLAGGGPGHAAFEAPAADPAAQTTAGGAAWPEVGRLARGGTALFDEGARWWCGAGSLRWPEVSGLRREAVGLARRGGALAGGVAVDRLALGDYAEMRALATLVRPVGETGWGGGVGAGVALWGVPGARQRAVPLLVEAGARPRGGVRLALSWRTHVGSDAATLEERLEAGATWEMAPGWRAGLGFDSRAAGTRWRAALECRPAPGVAVRGAFTPADGSTAFGLDVRRGALRVALAEGRHPRLGPLVSAAVALVGGSVGGAAPVERGAPSPDGPGEIPGGER